MKELDSLRKTYHHFLNLNKSGQLRALMWLISKLELETEVSRRLPQNDVLSQTFPTKPEYPTPADLSSLSQSELVLVCAYNLQRQLQLHQFLAKHITEELQKSGLRLTNVAKVLNDLINRNPALIRVIAGGSGVKTRKRYELTTAGKIEAQRLLH